MVAAARAVAGITGTGMALSILLALIRGIFVAI
jgi:hypothetical protein